MFSKAERVKEKGEEDRSSPRWPEGIALAELDSFIEELRMVSTVELPVFRLAELVNKYTLSTRFLKKDRILFQIPAFEDHKQGRDVFLAF